MNRLVTNGAAACGMPRSIRDSSHARVFGCFGVLGVSGLQRVDGHLGEIARIDTIATLRWLRIEILDDVRQPPRRCCIQASNAAPPPPAIAQTTLTSRLSPSTNRCRTKKNALATSA